ncbi:uncharacterized protein LOC142589915 isoform X15 [Dermacentor variabilis]|uniref:uncharacterized protein LOC142589915 isoform X15 n=1 Tax=Dermacentor variabilis TaxID=34621 RepID=UPI003F5C85D5
MRNEVTVAMGHSMGGHWFWLDHLSPEALRPIWIVLGGHWFWATSHPKPCDLFGSTSPLTATQAGIVNALWQSIACIAVQCGAPTLRSAITDSLQSSEVSSSG